jgi:predicted O-methyltransferase YrrM
LSLVLDPQGAQKFFHQVLDAQDLEFDDPVLPGVDLTDLVSSQAEPRLVGPYQARHSGGTGILLELGCLAYLMQALQPKIIFEIGTFVGRTTRLLALNSPKDARVFTLDLPPERVAHVIGENYRHTAEQAKITQLYGDTRTFDYSSWYGQCDFVWVDACHDLPCVRQDSREALKLRRPGGWIAWHDYRHTAWWSGVTRAVRELAAAHPGLRHLRRTTIAVLPPESQEPL